MSLVFYSHLGFRFCFLVSCHYFFSYGSVQWIKLIIVSLWVPINISLSYHIILCLHTTCCTVKTKNTDRMVVVELCAYSSWVVLLRSASTSGLVVQHNNTSTHAGNIVCKYCKIMWTSMHTTLMWTTSTSKQLLILWATALYMIMRQWLVDRTALT